MSHFTVLVIGDDIEQQLAPFQENNMGDCPPEYLKFFDMTSEVTDGWETDTLEVYANAKGEFSKVSTPTGVVKRIIDITYAKAKASGGKLYLEISPKLTAEVDAALMKEGWRKVEWPVKKVYPSIEEYAKEYHGYDQNEEGLYGYYENPNAKWDWYSVGGRWSGMFKLKETLLLDTDKVFFDELGFSNGELVKLVTLSKTDPKKFDQVISKYKGKVTQIREAVARLSENKKFYAPGVLGEPGVLGSCNDRSEGRADQALKRDIDFAGMERDAKIRAEEGYTKFEKATEGIKPPLPWKEFRELAGGDANIQEARKAWHAHPWVEALRKADMEVPFGDIHEYYCVGTGGRERFVERAINSAFSTYAVLKDGEWYQRGDMGWWGVSMNEKGEDDWLAETRKLVNDLPEDTLLTVVDCHI